MSSPDLHSPIPSHTPHLPQLHWPDFVVKVSLILCVANLVPFLASVGTRDMLGATATLIVTFVLYNALVFGIWESYQRFRHVNSAGKVLWGILLVMCTLLLGVVFIASFYIYGFFLSGTLV